MMDLTEVIPWVLRQTNGKTNGIAMIWKNEKYQKESKVEIFIQNHTCPKK